MSTTTVALLRAASEILGGHKALAQRLGIRPTLLYQFMADVHELPDSLLLQAVDIILADRQSRLALAGQPATPSPQEAMRES